MSERLYRYPTADPYVVCDRLLDPETNEHCEFDGRVQLDADRFWRCPGCHHLNYEPEPSSGFPTEVRNT